MVDSAPSGWHWVDLASLCNLQRGFDITEATREPGDVPVYSSSGISYRVKHAKVAPPILITGRKGLLGRVFLVREPAWPHDTTLWADDFRGNDPEFVALILESFHLEKLDAATSVPTLNRNNLIGHNVLVPRSRLVQEQIVSAVAAAEATVASLSHLVAKKRCIKQGMMQELLTGRTRLPGFKEEWSTLRVAPSSHLKARIGWQGLTTGEYRSSGAYRLVGGTDFRDGRVDWAATPYVDKWRFDQDRNIQLKLGDVLITKDGTIGKVAYVDVLPGPATLNSGVFVVRPKASAYNSGFLYHMLRSRFFDDFVAGLSAGSTINHLYQRDLVKLNLRVPSDLEEQRRIAETLFDADSEITALNRRLEEARVVKQGMMQELLTGRTRLPVREDAA